MENEQLPELLRAIASGTQAQENKHDIILNAAADELEELRHLTRLNIATMEETKMRLERNAQSTCELTAAIRDSMKILGLRN
jgi:hypothetical protein